MGNSRWLRVAPVLIAIASMHSLANDEALVDVPPPVKIDVGFSPAELLISPDGTKLACIGAELGKMRPGAMGIQRALVVTDLKNSKSVVHVRPAEDLKTNASGSSRTNSAATFSPDGRLIVWTCTNTENAIEWHDFASGKTHPLKLDAWAKDDAEQIADPAANPIPGAPEPAREAVGVAMMDAQRVAIAWYDKPPSLVDLGGPKPVIQSMPELTLQVRGIAAVPGTSLLVISDNEQSTALVDVDRKRTIRQWNTGEVERLGVSRDGALIHAIVNGRAVVWETLTQEVVFESGDNVSALAFHPDNRHIAVASRGPEVDLWDIVDRVRVAHMEPAFLPEAVAFGADGKSLIVSTMTMNDAGSTRSEVLRYDTSNATARRAHAPVEATPQELWSKLQGADAAQALQAIHALAASGDRAVALIGPHVDAVKPHPNDAELVNTIAKEIERLDAKGFADREAASERLLLLGDAARSAVQQAAEHGPSLEARERAGALLKELDSPKSSRPLVARDDLALARAVRVLALINTPESRTLLEKLSKDSRHAFISTLATASLAK